MPRVAKRKSTVKDEDFENVEPVEEKISAAKKRKTTKGAKAGENMKLAERTAVSSLKKAMYIGAHVSGAGGSSQPAFCSLQFATTRCPPRHRECASA